MAEMEAPQLPALDQGREQLEVCATVEMIDVVGIETDPVKVHQIIMDYAEDLNRQARPSQVHTDSKAPVTKSSPTSNKSEQ